MLAHQDETSTSGIVTSFPRYGRAHAWATTRTSGQRWGIVPVGQLNGNPAKCQQMQSSNEPKGIQAVIRLMLRRLVRLH
jgi:hypothetical protein